ncbi:hypothetical protein [Acrocarpospora catenulata]|uniref:hypothetical protein n=1 Tax=Acrocarpospora catenulata TaxID=2836182 RepID=UPI001BDB6CCC|nr:hypothetical protein [Acrocarpospora catenulata]
MSVHTATLAATVAAVLDGVPVADCTPVISQPQDRCHVLVTCGIDEFWRGMPYTTQHQLVSRALEHWRLALANTDLAVEPWWPGVSRLAALVVADQDHIDVESRWALAYLSQQQRDGAR